MSVEIGKSIPLKLRDFVCLPRITSSKSVFKTGSIELNGKRIQVSADDTLETFASKVNAKNYATKVKAEIIAVGTQKKLLLKSKFDVLDFNDLSGIFTNCYKQGNIGVGKNSLIQVIKDSSGSKPSEVSFNYYRILNKQSSLSAHNVSELNKFELSRYTTNNLADDTPKLVALPKVKLANPPTPLSMPAMGGAVEIPQLIGTPLAGKTAAFTPPLGHPIVPYHLPNVAILQNIERQREIDINNMAQQTIRNALSLVMGEKGLTKIATISKQRLVDELGDALFLKHKNSEVDTFTRKCLPLAVAISKALGASHQTTWSYLTFSANEFLISDESIIDVKAWIERNL